MSSPLIRTASVDDAGALRTYLAQLLVEDLPGLFRRPVPTLEDEIEFISRMESEANSVLLLAVTADGAVAGSASLRGKPHAEEAHVATLGITVASSHRNLGLGSSLIGAAEEWASAHGITRIELDVFATNPEARRLYERLGFVHEGVLRCAVLRDGCYIDSHVMAKLLVGRDGDL